MITGKNIMFLFALSMASQIESSSGNLARKIIAGVAAGGGIATVGSIAAYKINTHILLADPNAKKAFAMLRDSKECMVSFGFYHYVIPSELETIQEAKAKNLGAAQAYDFTKALTEDFGDGAVMHLRVCFRDSCVAVKSIERRYQLEAFLKRIDSVEAPLLGSKTLRRLINRITNPK